MENKNRERALRAWETMNERGFHKFKDRPEGEMYNNPKKNKTRTKIVSLIKKYGGKNVLTLETHNFMLPNLLKKNTFFIAEENEEEYLKMLKNKPTNVFLHCGNISEMCSLTKDFEVVYLDFCCGYNSATKIITKLKDKIFNSKLVGFTFSLRGNKKEFLEDYTLDLIFKLQEFLGSDFRPIYKTSYADSSAVATIFFSKRTEVIKREDNEKETNKIKKTWEEEHRDNKKITKWAIKKMESIYPHVWTPHQIFDSRAKTHLIKNKFGTLIIERLFYLAMKEKIFSYPQYNIFSYRREEELNLDGMYDYFEGVLFRNIWNLWKEQDKHWRYWGINWETFSSSGKDLFLINKKSKRDKCFLCKDEKGIFKFKNKDFCTDCYIHQVCRNGFSEYESCKSKTIISEKDLFPRYSCGGYYNGSNNCCLCKKKVCLNNLKEKKEIEIVEFIGNVYCKDCFNNEIKERLEAVIELRKDYQEELEKKKCGIYKLIIKKR